MVKVIKRITCFMLSVLTLTSIAFAKDFIMRPTTQGYDDYFLRLSASGNVQVDDTVSCSIGREVGTNGRLEIDISYYYNETNPHMYGFTFEDNEIAYRLYVSESDIYNFDYEMISFEFSSDYKVFYAVLDIFNVVTEQGCYYDLTGELIRSYISQPYIRLTITDKNQYQYVRR